MPSPVRVGFIGGGQLFQEIYLPAFSQFREVDLLALCDIREAALASSLKRFGIRETTSRFQDVVDMSEVDAVVITVPNHLHASIAEKALRAGKHVLLHKPMALEDGPAEIVRQAAQETGQVFVMALPYRFDVESILLRQWIREGRLGETCHVRAGLVHRRQRPKGWFTDRALSGGGALLQLGAHLVDLALWLLDFPSVQSVSATCHGGDRRPLAPGPPQDCIESLVDRNVDDVEDFGTIHMRLEGGRSVSLEAGWQLHCQDDREYLEVSGTLAGASLWPLKRFEEEGGLLSDVVPRYERIDHHKALVKSFLDCIMARESPIECPVAGNADDGFRLVRLMRCVYESARTGREVEVDGHTAPPARAGGRNR